MSQYKIEFSKEARNDLISIVDYIKNNLQEPNIAKKIAQKIREQIYSLSNSPKIFPIIDDKFLRKLELRKTIVDNYIIFYKVIDKEKMVQIIRIIYGKRNWIELL